MALDFSNRVRFTTATTGTGTINVGTAITGFQLPSASSVPSGSTVGYVIEDTSGLFEVGTGVYTSGSPATLSRAVVEDGSSGSGVLITLTGNAVVGFTATGAQLTGPLTGVAAITSGVINNATIGGVTPAAGTFTALTSTSGSIVATGGSINNSIIGGSTPAAGAFTAVTINDPSNSTTALTLSNTASVGANFKLVGNGVTTPNKYIRVLSGVFGIINSGYTAVPFSLTDAGALTITGALTTTGVISSGAVSGTTGTFTGAVSGTSITGTGTGTFNAVSVTAASVGSIQLIQGDATHTGYVNLLNASAVQQGYIGFGAASSTMNLATAGTTTGWTTSLTFGVGTSLSVGTTATFGGAISSGTHTVTGSVSASGGVACTGALSGGQGSGIGFTNGTGLLINQSTASVASGLIINLANTGSLHCYFEFAGTGLGSINTNGSVINFNTTSDATLKLHDGRIAFDHAGRIIDGLEPLWYRWSRTPELESQAGFFVQAVHAHVPTAVTEAHTTADGVEMPWQLDQTKLIPFMVTELQSLRKRVAELEVKVLG